MADFALKFGTDENLENDGKWFDLGEGIEVKLARIGNKNYIKALKKYQKPYLALIRAKALNDEQGKDILVKTLAESVLLDFKGVILNGETLEPTFDNRERLLRDFKDFRAQVSELAGEMEAFKQQLAEDARKNSETSSSGR